jgi:hypothetical protein
VAHPVVVRERTPTAADLLVVDMVCKVCGRPFTLANADGGADIPNRDAFLATHARCLHRGDAAGTTVPSPRRPKR